MAGEALEQSGHAVAVAAAAKDKAAEADKKATKALQVSGMLLDFKKSHVFDVHQGIPVAHDPNVVAPAATSGAAEEIEAPKMPAMPTADITPVQPAWVAFDRKVLRFNCFFKEVSSRFNRHTPLFFSSFFRSRGG